MTDAISGFGQGTKTSASTPAATEEGTAQAYLLAHLPDPLRGRVKQLLRMKYNQCGPAAPQYPRNCYEAAAFVNGLKFIGRRRSPAQGHEPMLDEQEKIAEMLFTGGFTKVASAIVFDVGTEPGKTARTIIGANLAAVPKNMKAGDLIMFGGWSYNKKGQVVDHCVHATVYLGSYRGKDYVFEKENLFCGPDGPYQIKTLAEVIKDKIGLPEVYGGVYLDRIFVLRKTNR